MIAIAIGGSEDASILGKHDGSEIALRMHLSMAAGFWISGV